MRAVLNKEMKISYRDAVESGAYAIIRKDLTLSQKQYLDADKEIELFRHNGTFLWMPRWYGHSLLSIAKYRLEDLRYIGQDLGVEFIGRLGKYPYPSQQLKAVEEYINGCRENGFGGFLVAECGTGKTVMGCAIAVRLGGPTLILVHKAKLMNQWKDTIETFVRIDGKVPKVGIVREGRCEYGTEFPFSIAMIQSLNSREYPADFFESWRTIETDEVHHLGAKTWLKAVSQFNPLYLVGLTATLRRRDGLQPVFNHVIGPVLFELKRDTIQADCIFVPIPYVGSSDYFYPGGNFSKVRLEKRLSNVEYRNITLIEQITRAHRAGRRRHFVFSALRRHLKTLHKMLPPEVKVDADFYIGQRTEEALKKALQKRIIFSTYEMGAEGLDVDDIDLITLATPAPDIIQTVGRALRFYVRKAKPLVVDLVDTIQICKGWAYNREKQYRELGFKLRNTVSKALEKFNAC